MPRKPVLILIPGIGDRSRAYEVFATIWRLLGFEVHIIVFGWIDMQSQLKPKMARFLERLDAFDPGREVFVIGISAGGTAAVSALVLRPRLVRKVIAVCSPLDRLERLRNPLLAESVEQARSDLARLDAAKKRRILSVYALYDQVVTTKLSQSRGVKHMRLWSFLHAPTIFMALTFRAFKLRRFLRRG